MSSSDKITQNAMNAYQRTTSLSIARTHSTTVGPTCSPVNRDRRKGTMVEEPEDDLKSIPREEIFKENSRE